MAPFAVVICGGGIAGIEGLLRLRRLAGDQVAITLLTPEDDLIYRPRTVLEPFGLGHATHYPIKRIVADAGVHWVRDRVAWVDTTADADRVDRVGRAVHTAEGNRLHYDALLLAVGASQRKPDPGVSIFSDRTGGEVYRRIVEEVESGVVRSIALIEPAGPSWPLPLYELALLTAKRAREVGARPDLTLVTTDPRPLHTFGDQVSDSVTRLLRNAGITLHTGARATVQGPGRLLLEPEGAELRPDRIVSLPTIIGPNVRGILGDGLDRFIPVDEYCRVRGAGGHVFGAGDATDLAVKHGGLGSQQADTAAAGIAHLAGAAPAPHPLRPVMRGTLLTGDQPLYVTAYLIAGSGWRAELHDQPPWHSDAPVVAEELGPYLAAIDAEGTSPFRD